MTAPEMTVPEACALLRRKVANLEAAGWGGSFEAAALRTVLDELERRDAILDHIARRITKGQ